MRFALTFFITCLCFTAFSQWVVRPIPRVVKKTNYVAPLKKRIVITRADLNPYKNARIQDTTTNDSTKVDTVAYLPPRLLPFWDDFSHSTTAEYPDSTLWQYGRAVSWNFGLGINPPSLGVVSFNGLDSLENPYDPTNSLTKGYGDRMTSWTLNLDTVAADQRDSVFLSFFFEYQGNGEMPDPGDHLLVEFREFKHDTVSWVSVAEVDIDNDSTLTIHSGSQSGDGIKVSRVDSIFYRLNVQVTGSAFFHDQFQFRISSFGRISGPWDSWIVDYVYLNTHRSFDDVSFPDRTIFAPLSSLFGDYWSIPASHFHADTASLIVHPQFGVTNLRQNQTAGQGQPVSYNSSVNIQEYKKGVESASKSIKLDSAATTGLAIIIDEKRIVKLDHVPMVSDFTTDSDSIVVDLRTSINSGDNIIDHVAPRDSGDYLPKFVPIDFRVNDSTRSVQVLSSYYAYDDGSAEFAAGLNSSGTEVAYRFDMKTNQPDNILAVDLYFPNVGDQSSQTIVLTIRKDTTVHGTIYSETINLVRSSENKFIRHKLSRNTVQVQDHFYIGYRQTSSGVIALGLDTSHDTSDKIFFNVIGFWETTTNLKGSLMIRPVLGTGGVDTGLDIEPVALDVFPNPTTSGAFYLSKTPDQLDIVDFTGRKVSFVRDDSSEHLKISLANPTPGIYLIKASIDGKLVTRRVMVQR